jgi:hypothetical protein
VTSGCAREGKASGGSSSVTGILFTVTRQFVLHKARQQSDTLQHSERHSHRRTRPYPLLRLIYTVTCGARSICGRYSCFEWTQNKFVHMTGMNVIIVHLC